MIAIVLSLYLILILRTGIHESCIVENDKSLTSALDYMYKFTG